MVRKRRNYISIITLTLVSVIVLCFGVKSVLAEIKGQGLTVSPPSVELTLNPGQTSTQTIRLTNPTGKIIEFYPKTMNFKSNSETGEPSFYEGNNETYKFSLSQWITYPTQKMVMTPEQVIDFKYNINVPTDAEPGGHYGVVFFASDPTIDNSSGSSKVNLGSMVGSLIFVKVPGDIVEQAILEDFSTNRYLYTKGDVDLITRILNTGNIHIKPKGTITIKGMFGDSTKISFNDTGGYVLPESTRKYENKWKPGSWKFGRYTANLMLVYGEKNTILQKTVVFWLIPWWLIILVGGMVVLVLFFWWRRRRKNKKRKNLPSNDPNRVVLR